MMQTTIENPHLLVRIAHFGAELQQIVAKADQTEYLWQGDARYWKRRSPVLFPIVGALRGGHYTFEGQQYALPQHGFARDRAFTLIAKGADYAVFELTDDAQSRAVYPFAFALQIRYGLKANRLQISYLVSNPSDGQNLWYSIGAHPAFRCPLKPGTQRSDYAFVFSQPETLDRQLIAEGLRTGQRERVLEQSRRIPIDEPLFDQDALIFEGAQSASVALCLGEQPLVSLSLEGFPYLGLWSKNREATFVCIEPWLGITDHATHNGQLTDKEGIRPLAAGQHHHHSFEITIHQA